MCVNLCSNETAFPVGLVDSQLRRWSLSRYITIDRICRKVHFLFAIIFLSGCTFDENTDADQSRRTPFYPNGVTVATRDECCTVCAADSECIVGVYQPGSCWPMKYFTNLIFKSGTDLVFPGKPALPSSALRQNRSTTYPLVSLVLSRDFFPLLFWRLTLFVEPFLFVPRVIVVVEPRRTCHTKNCEFNENQNSVNGVRTSFYANGVTVATQEECCTLCTADLECVAAIHNKVSFCWPLSSYSGTVSDLKYDLLFPRKSIHNYRPNF